MFIKVDLDEPFIDGEGGQIWELTGGRSFIYGAAYCRLPTATVPHWHAETFEQYYLVRGRGRTTVGLETQDVGPGTLVLIPPRTAHYTVPHRGEMLELLVGTVPAWRADDTLPLSSSDASVGYSERHWVDELLSELNRRGIKPSTDADWGDMLDQIRQDSLASG
jgi:mannose-6-phosphate isomerase-like protein (cupin superfamily)